MIWYTGGGEIENAAVKAIEEELVRSSDRAVAILAGSLVETRLTAFLKHHVVDDKVTWEKLIHSSAPLGSFSVKIDVAFLFHLISKDAHRDLTIMKDVRNKFAHDLTIRDFQTQTIRDKCANLRLVETYIQDSDAMTSLRRVDDSPDTIVSGYTHTFRLGGRGAKAQLSDPRHRYIWSTKLFNLALGIFLRPREPSEQPHKPA